MQAFAATIGTNRVRIGNDLFELVVSLNPNGLPVVHQLVSRVSRSVDWNCGAVVAPVLEIGGQRYACADGNLAFKSMDIDTVTHLLRLRYETATGIMLCHCLMPSTRYPVLITWTVLENVGTQPITGISRFDALNLRLGVSAAEPLCTYLLGWLYGPRVDAPGRHTVPYAYPSWIPYLLYGDGPRPLLHTQEGGWHAPILRPIKGERLTRLPLRSGKRSTFENHPWAAVLDPQQEAGFFAGFTWSGTWKMDLEHYPAEQTVSVSACSDGCVHTLQPGAKLESPQAFLGFFEGDWDEASNATRRYVSNEIMPPMSADFPVITNDMSPLDLSTYRNGKLLWREELDAIAAAGIDLWDIDAGWWAERYAGNDFSLGLGCFEDNRGQWPDGFRTVSDYAHSLGVKIGLWFEIERVDIRTANRGRRPWRSEWLVHHKGYPHRSWCQHVFSLCLGVKEAQGWAIDNLGWAVREYGLDHVLIDSNEWAVCDDPAHGHGERDGEWAQIQGLYQVLEALRSEFPGLMITNLGGGSQRSDPGMSRFFHRMCPADVICPVAVNRKYGYGIGFLYPVGFSGDCVAEYPDEQTGRPLPDASGHIPREELEWRCLNAMGGALSVLLRMRRLDQEGREVLAGAVAFFKQLRQTLWGDRYVLAGPQPFIEKMDRMAGHREAGNWEVYQQLSPGEDLVALFMYRCHSPQPRFSVRLRGLERGAAYHAQFYSGKEERGYRGDELMAQGITCHLPNPRSGDILLLRRV